jgi:superoxide dismutase, Fe-Mn family
MKSTYVSIMVISLCVLLASCSRLGKRVTPITMRSPMQYTLPALPYPYDALEPYLDARTLEIHYSKHHAGYVAGLNRALERHPELFSYPLEWPLDHLEDVPEDIRSLVRDHGGGHANHTFFWNCMSPVHKQQPSDALKDAITQSFGSFADFQAQWKQLAMGHIGSGWVWLLADEKGKLKIVTTYNHELPHVPGYMPILIMDIWEHAYYLKYQNLRGNYIDAWWDVVNWPFVATRYQAATKTNGK